MKELDILEALGDLDDEMITRAYRKRNRAPAWLRSLSLAACLILVVGLVAGSVLKLSARRRSTGTTDALAQGAGIETQETLQTELQKQLAGYIAQLSGNSDADLAGTVLVLDPESFQVLAAAAASAEQGDETPEEGLPARALEVAGAPGAAFMPVAAIAAMRCGVDPDAETECTGAYRLYTDEGYTPSCRSAAGTDGHGTVTLTSALALTCDVGIFSAVDAMARTSSEDGSYETVNMEGAAAEIGSVAMTFGFGEATGAIQSGTEEQLGRIASPEVKQAVYGSDSPDGGWYTEDTFSLAIGASLTQVTPMQLCRYTAVLANGGDLLCVQYGNSQNEAVESRYGLLSDSENAVIREGLQSGAEIGVASEYLQNLDAKVCCIAGSVKNEDGSPENLVFTAWAPADNPQFVLTLYINHIGDNAGAGYELAGELMRSCITQLQATEQNKTEAGEADTQAIAEDPSKETTDGVQSPLVDDTPAEVSFEALFETVAEQGTDSDAYTELCSVRSRALTWCMQQFESGILDGLAFTDSGAAVEMYHFWQESLWLGEQLENIADTPAQDWSDWSEYICNLYALNGWDEQVFTEEMTCTRLYVQLLMEEES